MCSTEISYFKMNPFANELDDTIEFIPCSDDDIVLPRCNSAFGNKNRFRPSPERIGCNLGSRTWQICFKEVVPTKMILTNSGPFDNGCSVTPKKEFHSNEDNKPESPLVSDSSIDSSSSCEIIFNDSEFINSECTLETDDVDDDDEDDSEDDSCSESDGNTSPNEDRFSHKTRKVTFNLTPVVHTMFKWDYAYRAARKGPWEQMARDRYRFKRRINSFRHILDPILQVDHRIRIWAERFS